MKDLLKKALETAKRKFLKETFDFLLEIDSPKIFKASSDIPTVNNIEFSIEKGVRCFNFKTSALNLVKDFANHQKDGYGFFKPLTFQNDNSFLKIPKGVSKMTLALGKDMKAEGEMWEVENSFNVSDQKYFRLVLPKSYNPNKDHHSFIQSERFAVDDYIKFSGLMEFHCDQNLFHLFDYNSDDKYFLFIDSMNPMIYAEFEKSIGAILYSIGVITGYISRNEMYILQSENCDFKIISGFQFRKIENTLSSGMEVVSPRLLSEIAKSKYEEGHISLNVFSNIVSKAKNDNRFLRALKIISEGNEYPLEIRASTYSVALETIKNIILEENEEKINPFKEKSFAREIIKNLKQIIVPLDNSHFNNKEAILNKLEHINQVTNKDSFKLAFSLCGFKLSQIDEEALLKRNDFLHGRIPFEDEADSKQNQELKFITYKLHFLVTTLIMKYSKFNGLLKNNPKFFSVFGEDNKEIDEPLFRNA